MKENIIKTVFWFEKGLTNYEYKKRHKINFNCQPSIFHGLLQNWKCCVCSVFMITYEEKNLKDLQQVIYLMKIMSLLHTLGRGKYQEKKKNWKKIRKKKITF